MAPMTFTYFQDCMNDVKHDYDYYDKVCDATNSDFMYENLRAAGLVLDMLGAIFEDTADWIAYYCFELNWGEDYTPGMVKDKEGNNIPLANLSDLYRLLCKNYKENNF